MTTIPLVKTSCDALPLGVGATIVMIEPDPGLIDIVRELSYEVVVADREALRHGHGLRQATGPDTEAGLQVPRWLHVRGAHGGRSPMGMCLEERCAAGRAGGGMPRAADAPIIAATGDGSFAHRLMLMRAGAGSVVRLPADREEVRAALDEVSVIDEPSRVLVVDDDPVALALARAHLRQAGFLVETIADPYETLDAIAHFRPDVALFDAEMPGCSGMELSRLVRGDPSLLGLPILFLSGLTDPDSHLAALKAGADAFLTKPVNGRLVIQTIRAIVARVARLERLANRDALTGCLSARATRDEIRRTLALAGRQDRPASLALIDVDHFKRVNDVHGHAVGDHVLRRLGSFLMTELRGTDAVGRLGGEEFVVVMMDIAQADALVKIDAIRARFSTLDMPTVDASSGLRCSFSAGIAQWNPPEVGSALLHRADAALYAAKRGGRDRVALA